MVFIEFLQRLERELDIFEDKSAHWEVENWVEQRNHGWEGDPSLKRFRLVKLGKSREMRKQEEKRVAKFRNKWLTAVVVELEE